MTDILTHALVGYALGTLLSLQYDWLDRRWVTVVMVGATLPDIDKVHLFVSDPATQQLLGIPFTWELLHLPVGTLVVCLLGSLLVGDQYRRRVFGLLVLGASTHYGLDALAVFTSGYSYPFLWPLSASQFPAGEFYQSSDRWPVVVAGLAAGLVYALERARQ